MVTKLHRRKLLRKGQGTVDTVSKIREYFVLFCSSTNLTTFASENTQKKNEASFTKADINVLKRRREYYTR